MPMSHRNQRLFTRKLFCNQLKTITLLKRNDDQQAGTVTSIVLYECRRGQITKTGEPIQADMTSSHRCIWHIPLRQLQRVGIRLVDINAADRIVETHGDDNNQPLPPLYWRYWEPESTTTIDQKLFLLELDIAAVRIDPPNAATIAGANGL